jgi:hypothetical protein
MRLFRTPFAYNIIKHRFKIEGRVMAEGNRLQECCENISRFLSSDERTMLFEKFVSLLPISDSKPAPIRQAAKILGVSETMVYKWKRKEDAPGPENTSKIVAEIIKRDPFYFDSLSNKLMDNVLKTYFLLLDQKLCNDSEYGQYYINVRELAVKYIPALTTMLLYNSRTITTPQVNTYPRFATPEIQRILAKKYLGGLANSIEAINTLVIEAKVTYNNLINQNISNTY